MPSYNENYQVSSSIRQAGISVFRGPRPLAMNLGAAAAAQYSLHSRRGRAHLCILSIYKTSIEARSPCQFVPRIVPIYPVDLRRSCRYVPCIVPVCPVHRSSPYRFLPWLYKRHSRLSRGQELSMPVSPVARAFRQAFALD